MNLPNLPTDNLYKFATLSGLILILAGAAMSIVVPANEIATANSHRIDQMKERIELTDRAISQSTEIFRRTTTLLTSFRKDAEDNEDLARIVSSQIASEENARDSIFRSLESRLQALDLSAKVNSEISNERIKISSEVGKQLVTFGVWCGGCGMMFWWYCHQRHQDRRASARARKAESDAPPATIYSVADLFRDVASIFGRKSHFGKATNKAPARDDASGVPQPHAPARHG